MSNILEEAIDIRTKRYANFAGILIGFSISIAVIIISLTPEKVSTSTHYCYSLAAFVYSSLAFFNTYTWYGQASEESEEPKKQRKYFFYGTLFYYTGYWGILLGLIYLTSTITFHQTLNFPFLISLAFLGYAFALNIYAFLWQIFYGERTWGIILLALLSITIFLSYSTIPREPVVELLRIVNPF